MRNYLILKDKAQQFNDDPEIQGLLSEIRSNGANGIEPLGSYSRARAESIKSMPLDRAQLANKPLPYERLDQLTIDILLGVR
jgi:xylose isomerase